MELLTPRGFNKHRQPTKHVGYFAQRSRLLFSLTLESGNKLDLDRLFASDLKYLRKIWDLMYIVVQIDRKYIIFCTQFSAQKPGNRILGH